MLIDRIASRIVKRIIIVFGILAVLFVIVGVITIVSLFKNREKNLQGTTMSASRQDRNSAVRRINEAALTKASSAVRNLSCWTSIHRLKMNTLFVAA